MSRRRWARIRSRCQLVQYRQRKPGRFAGAGLGAAHDILAGKNQWDCLRLDRRRRGVTGFGNGAEQFRPQAELGKARGTTHSMDSWTRPTLVRVPVQAATLYVGRRLTPPGGSAVTGTAAECRAS